MANQPPASSVSVAQRQLEALNSCIKVAGTITAHVNEQLQAFAQTLSPYQDDLMDMYHVPGASSHPGAAPSASKQASGNIPMISGQMGHQALQACLARKLGKTVDFEAIAKAIEQEGGPITQEQVETGGLISRKITQGKHRAISVPRQ